MFGYNNRGCLGSCYNIVLQDYNNFGYNPTVYCNSEEEFINWCSKTPELDNVMVLEAEIIDNLVAVNTRLYDVKCNMLLTLGIEYETLLG